MFLIRAMNMAINEKESELMTTRNCETDRDYQGHLDSILPAFKIHKKFATSNTAAKIYDQVIDKLEKLEKSSTDTEAFCQFQAQIKTQKEYIAVLKEVDTAKKLAKELQDQIDAKNETLTSLSVEKTEKDEEFAKAKEQTGERCAEIDASLVSVVEKLDEMERQRKGLLADLPTRLRKRYELLMSRRGGVAVVEARSGACLGCHMHLPPQLFNSLYVVKEIQACPHCNRLLFVTATN